MKKQNAIQITFAIISACVLILLLIVFIVPLIVAFLPLFRDSFGELKDFSFRVGKIALFTVQQAFCSMLISLIIGIPTAFFVARRQFFGRKFLLSLSSVPFCFPALLVALGFVMTYGMQGFINKFFMKIFDLNESPVTFLYSFLGIIIIHGFYNFPIVMRICSDSWQQLPVDEKNAATMLGANSFRIFRTVTFFQLLPAISSSAIMAFLYSFFSFIIVLLFGGIGISVLEVEIYQAVRSSLDFNYAAILSFVETFIAFLIIIFYTVIEKKSKRSKGIAFYEEVSIRSSIKSIKEKICLFIIFVFIFLFFLLPFFSIILSAFKNSQIGYLQKSLFSFLSFDNFIKLFSRQSFFYAFINTILIGIATGFLSVIAASFFCCFQKYFLEKQNFISKIIPLLPMAVSSIVLGFGIMQVIPKGNIFCLILLQSALCWPLAYKQIFAQMEKIPNDVLYVGKILSKNSLDSVFKICLPMCKKSMFSAFGLCFAISCGDTNLPLIMAIPKLETLALYTYKLASSYRFYESCACGIILALLTVPIFILSNQIAKRKEKGKN